MSLCVLLDAAPRRRHFWTHCIHYIIATMVLTGACFPDVFYNTRYYRAK